MIDIDKLSASVPRSDAEYMGQDGFLHCKTCGEALELIIEVPNIGERKVRCICSCKAKELNAEKERMLEKEKERKRKACFHGSKFEKSRFEKSEDCELLKVGRNYVNHFRDFRKMGKGLLFYGTVGTGKSHAAACIANKLIDEGYTAYMTNFATIVNKLQATWEKQEFIDNLIKYDLLIIDDLGVERETGFMDEQIFNVIDARLLSELPLIITTNLNPEELKKPADIRKARVYDRLLGQCHPVQATGTSYRRKKLKDEFQQTEMILKG